MLFLSFPFTVFPFIHVETGRPIDCSSLASLASQNLKHSNVRLYTSMTTENKYKTEEKNNKINGLNCPHIEMKLIQYSVTTV